MTMMMASQVGELAKHVERGQDFLPCRGGGERSLKRTLPTEAPNLIGLSSEVVECSALIVWLDLLSAPASHSGEPYRWKTNLPAGRRDMQTVGSGTASRVSHSEFGLMRQPGRQWARVVAQHA